MKKILAVLFLLALPRPGARAEEPLTLRAYLAGVEAGQAGIAGARSARGAAALLREESVLATAPQFFGEAGGSVDRSGQLLPMLQGDSTKIMSGVAGASLKTRSGVEWKLYYAYGRDIVSGSIFGEIDQWRSSQNLELSVALWRNRKGREIDPTVRAEQARRDAQGAAAGYEAADLRLLAEQAYWRLAALKESVEISSGSLRRAVELLRWSRGRAAAGLADTSETLEAEAGVKVREQQLMEEADALRQAARRFNAFLGGNSAEAPPLMEGVDGAVEKPGPGVRGDIRAAGLYAEAAEYAAARARESLKPSLDLVSKLSLTGLSGSAGAAARGAFSTSGAAAALGLRLSLPFNSAAPRKVSRGYGLEAEAARLRYRQAVLDSEAEQAALSGQFDALQRQAVLARDVEMTQWTKYQAEQARREKGKSTVFLTLAYQDDYAAAQARRVGVALKLRLVRAQLELYGRN